MKMTPDFIRAQTNMMPGKITSDGFLGTDTRPISDIIQHDEETMQKFGLDFSGVAEKMRELEHAGNQGLGEPITVDGKWLIKVDQARGYLACPWEDGIFRKLAIQVEHIPSRKKIIFSELSIHMIEKHHFLQGTGNPFRLDPEMLKQVLEL